MKRSDTIPFRARMSLMWSGVTQLNWRVFVSAFMRTFGQGMDFCGLSERDQDRVEKLANQ